MKKGRSEKNAEAFHSNADYQCDDELQVMGYLRKNGEMGIRNELWIVPTVGCVNGQAQAIAER